jgi:hypothetical protein
MPFDQQLLVFHHGRRSVLRGQRPHLWDFHVTKEEQKRTRTTTGTATATTTATTTKKQHG